MAQRYVVQKDDNPLTLSKKFATSATTILAANGIKTLTPGQTIRIPSTPSYTTVPTVGYGGTVQNFYGAIGSAFGAKGQSNIAPTGSFLAGGGSAALAVSQPTYGPPRPVSGSFISGAGQVYRPPVQTTGGMLSPEKNVVTGRPVLPTGSFVSGSGGVNLQGQSAGTTAAPAAAARPTGTYADNPAAWRAYWNASATAGRDVAATAAPAPVHIPTRAEIWNIKANQRRRRAAEEGGDMNTNNWWNGIPQTPVPVTPTIDPTLQNLGSAVNTALSWRVG